MSRLDMTSSLSPPIGTSSNRDRSPVAPSDDRGRYRGCTESLIPIALLGLIVAGSVWVYVDARHRADNGVPVVVSFGAFTVDTPGQWFVGCLCVWIVFLPVYITSRNR
jgi:hypothetical protein